MASLTSDGTNTGNFSGRDWLLVLTTAMIWGSSFLWIAIGLETLQPGVIAFMRTLLGAAVLWTVAPARRKVDRSAWPMITAVAIAGNAAPAVLFPLAQQRVESSVAGMMNSVSPVLVLLIAVGMTRKAPARIQLLGLAVGLVGAVLMALPNLVGAEAQPLGLALVVMAILGYATSNNLLPPLTQAWGGPAVMVRALALSAVLLLPYGVVDLGRSSFSWASVGAVTILGIFGTGIARTMFATLVGSVGAPRSSMIGYFVPIVAIVLGIVVRSESVGPLEIGGTALVLVGARLISRGGSSD